MGLTTKNSELLKTVTGALVNFSMDNDNIQQLLLESNAMELLLSILRGIKPEAHSDPHMESVFQSSIRAFSNIIETARGADELLAHRGLLTVFELLKIMHDVSVRPNITIEEYSRALQLLEGLVIVLDTIVEHGGLEERFLLFDPAILTFSFIFI